MAATTSGNDKKPLQEWSHREVQDWFERDQPTLKDYAACFRVYTGALLVPLTREDFVRIVQCRADQLDDEAEAVGTALFYALQGTKALLQGISGSYLFAKQLSSLERIESSQEHESLASTLHITLTNWLAKAIQIPQQLLNHPEYFAPLAELTNNEELRSFAIELLRRDDPFVLTSDEREEKREQLDQLIDLGLLEEPEADNSVVWTAPVIRDLVLQYVYPKKAPVFPSPPIMIGEYLHMETLLEQALLLLDQEALYSNPAWNSSSRPSEYAFQVELYSALRELIRSTTYRILPESKYKKKIGCRRINLLLVSSTTVVIVIKTNLRTKQSISKAATWACAYGQSLRAQQTILLNFLPSDASLLPADSESLYPSSEA